MAGCATRTSYAGHPSNSATADHELTFEPDHPMGADRYDAIVTAACEAWNRLIELPDRIRSIGMRDMGSCRSKRMTEYYGSNRGVGSQSPLLPP
jgi:hypothetical protein